MRNASFRQAILTKSTFVNAILLGADLMRASAKYCDFSKARLQNTDLRDADFERCIMQKVSLLHANINNQTSFTQAHIQDLGIEFEEGENYGRERYNPNAIEMRVVTDSEGN